MPSLLRHCAREPVLPALSEAQAIFRRAIASEAPDAAELNIVAPRDPFERLGIYRRHYRESFRRHLRGRYPTLEWLIGTPAMIDLADAALRSRPPRAPSLAEYGAEVIDIVAVAARDKLPPYVADVARLDWHLGVVSVAIEMPPLSIGELSGHASNLLDVGLALQPGLVYVGSEWPVDELVRLRLAEAAPERLEFSPQPIFLQLRGARGTFGWQRLTPAEQTFRGSLAGGTTLGAAAEGALGIDRNFDLSAALARLFADGLVTAIHPPATELPNV